MKLSKQPELPYQDEGMNKIYNLLFCDDIDLYRAGNESAEYPWNILLAAAPGAKELEAVANDAELETRQNILAYNLLAAQGIPVEGKELLGVIVEVAMPEGLDVLAAFSDGTARYINHSEKLLVWDAQTEQSEQLVDALFKAGMNVVEQIGKWDEERRPPPNGDMVRLSFLVSDGLYFGEGPFDVLQSDAMGGPVIGAAAQLMAYLTQQGQ